MLDYKGLKVGSTVRVKDLRTVTKEFAKHPHIGFPKSMRMLCGNTSKVTSLSESSHGVPVVRLHAGFSWVVDALINLDGIDMFKEGDMVTRTRRFTESFVEGERHEVQRVSDDGEYIWVGGYKGKTPSRYFKKVGKDYNTVSTSSDAPKAAKPELPVGGLTTFDDYEGKRKLGDNPSGCGLVARTEPARKFTSVVDIYSEKVANGEIPPTEIDQKLVAGLIMSGIEVELWGIGDTDWHAVYPTSLTVSRMASTSFRLKPQTMDYYGVTLPKPVDVMSVQDEVYGISFVNRKVYPCSNAVARKNVSNGQGHYWLTRKDAELVLATVLKPFLDLGK